MAYFGPGDADYDIDDLDAVGNDKALPEDDYVEEDDDDWGDWGSDF